MEGFKGTPGPWHVRFCDDRMSMNMTVITTDSIRDAFVHDNFNNESDTVAIVLHQCEPFVGIENEDCGDANAYLIAAAPDLLAFAIKMVNRYPNSPWIHEEGQAVINKALSL